MGHAILQCLCFLQIFDSLRARSCIHCDGRHVALILSRGSWDKVAFWPERMSISSKSIGPLGHLWNAPTSWFEPALDRSVSLCFAFDKVFSSPAMNLGAPHGIIGKSVTAALHTSSVASGVNRPPSICSACSTRFGRCRCGRRRSSETVLSDPACKRMTPPRKTCFDTSNVRKHNACADSLFCGDARNTSVVAHLSSQIPRTGSCEHSPAALVATASAGPQRGSLKAADVFKAQEAMHHADRRRWKSERFRLVMTVESQAAVITRLQRSVEFLRSDLAEAREDNRRQCQNAGHWHGQLRRFCIQQGFPAPDWSALSVSRPAEPRAPPSPVRQVFQPLKPLPTFFGMGHGS